MRGASLKPSCRNPAPSPNTGSGLMFLRDFRAADGLVLAAPVNDPEIRFTHGLECFLDVGSVEHMQRSVVDALLWLHQHINVSEQLFRRNEMSVVDVATPVQPGAVSSRWRQVEAGRERIGEIQNRDVLRLYRQFAQKAGAFPDAVEIIRD